MKDYPYDFDARARFWKYNMEGISFSWNTGVAIKQDVTVQLTIGESQLPYSNMFADLPVNFYVNGQPRLLTQGSGDHRVIVTVDGYNVDMFFVSTGISVKVFIRPNSVSSHIREIPGSFTTYICLPDDNPNIVDVTGLLGTPNGDQSDDWMDVNGNTITKDSMDEYDYCTDNWCIRDAVDSIFTFDDGYSFDDYNGCDDPIRSRHLVDLSTASDCVKKHCAQVDGDEACIYDGIQGGCSAAELAVESLKSLTQQRRAAITAETQDDAACCSRDFKTCDDSCGTNRFTCLSCDPNDTFKWLVHGPYDDSDGPLEHCLAKLTTCTASDTCCPGLECVSGTCVPKDSDTSRRLEEFVFSRPDLPFDRNIITYADLN